MASSKKMSSGASRGGNRGGRDQFQWDDVQQMSYKDREQYLGFSTKIGYLDKGGQWRKKDWWIAGAEEGEGKKKEGKEEQLRRERAEVRRQDEAIMNFKMKEKGLPCLDSKYEAMLEGCTDVAQVIQKVRQGDNVQMKGKADLQSHEFKQLVQKGGDAHPGEVDEGHLADKVCEGLGHEKRHHIASGAYSGLVEDQSAGKEDLKQLRPLEGGVAAPIGASSKEQITLNFIMEKLQARKQREKEEKARIKELRKESKRERSRERKKKDKSSKRKRSRSRSRDRDRPERRRRDDKDKSRKRSRSRS